MNAKRAADARVGQRVGGELDVRKLVVARVAIWNGDRVSAGRDCGTAAVGAVFEDHHLRRRNAEALRGEQVDIWVGFSALDIGGGENEFEAVLQAEGRENVFGILRRG